MTTDFDAKFKHAFDGGDALETFEIAVPVGVFKPRVSVVIPAFNEEGRIENTLLEWVSFLDNYFGGNYEVLVVMDGCSDGTVDAVYGFGGDYVIPLVFSRRLGKGGALIEAFKLCRGDVVFFTDADGAVPASEFVKFMKAIRDYDAVIGCRYVRGSSFLAFLPLRRFVFSRVFNALLRLMFPCLRGVYDTQCGAKAVRREVLDVVLGDLFITDFAFDVNLLYSVLRRGFSVREVGVEYNHVERRSKVSCRLLKTGLAMFFSVVRLRIYYSGFRKLLYSNRLRRFAKFLVRVVS